LKAFFGGEWDFSAGYSGGHTFIILGEKHFDLKPVEYRGL
jgi:hypothetical protein